MADFIWQNKINSAQFFTIGIPENYVLPPEIDIELPVPGLYICAFRTRKHAFAALEVSILADAAYKEWQVVEMIPGSWVKYRQQLLATGVLGLMVIDPITSNTEFVALEKL